MPHLEKQKYLALTRAASSTEIEEAQRDLEKWAFESKGDILHRDGQTYLEFDNFASFLNKSQVNKLKETYDRLKVSSLTYFQREAKAGS